MDSLLANYASSDDDEQADDQPTRPPTSSSSPPAAVAPPKPSPASASLISSLPPPKSLFSSSDAPPPPHPKKSSLFSSLPPPKSADPTQRGSLFSSLPPPQLNKGSGTNPSRTGKGKENDSFEEIGGDDGFGSSFPSASIFSSLPPPKSKDSAFTSIPAPKSESSNSVGLEVNPKKVVQFTPPIMNPSWQSKFAEEDEDEEENKKDSVVEPSFTPSSILSSMLPAPKNSLCLAPPSNSSNSSSRKSNLDAQLPAISAAPVQQPEQVQYDASQSYDPNWAGNVAQTGYVETSSSGYAVDYGSVEGYGGYEGYNWSTDAAVGGGTGGASAAMEVHDLGRVRGKRGRNDKPPEIVEVKRDELMKNRPRQDQAKLTGIAFGPSYQPAPSGKEKPTKLHKRKHQIGALYFDMRQKEMELAERRSKGFLTKAETQAKYGW